MPVTSVNVTGTLKMPSGSPAALATVRFTLSSPGLLGVTVVLPFTVRTTADANGVFTVTLAPNSLNSYYAVTVYRANGVVLLETVAVVPAFDCQFSQVIQARQPSQTSASIEAIAQLQTAQANIEVVRLEVLATADATNKDTRKAKANIEAVRLEVLATADATNVGTRNAKENIEAVRLEVIATADAVNVGTRNALTQIQSATVAYEARAAETQNTVDELIDTVIGMPLDLVSAYQLSK